MPRHRRHRIQRTAASLWVVAALACAGPAVAADDAATADRDIEPGASRRAVDRDTEPDPPRRTADRDDPSSASGAEPAAATLAPAGTAMPSATPGDLPGAGAPIPAAPRGPWMRDDAVVAALAGLVEQSHRVVRGYAQLGLGVRAGGAQAAIADALRAGDRQLAALAWAPHRRIGAERQRELAMRWRALRDGAATRPDPAIARLMDDAARQLSAHAADAIAALPPAPRPLRLRVLLQRMAGAHLLACWGAVAPMPARMLELRIAFGHLLADGFTGADAVSAPAELDAATTAAQWGLLADALDGHGASCDAAATDRVASTADRLVQLLDAPGARMAAQRRP